MTTILESGIQLPDVWEVVGEAVGEIKEIDQRVCTLAQNAVRRHYQQIEEERRIPAAVADALTMYGAILSGAMPKGFEKRWGAMMPGYCDILGFSPSQENLSAWADRHAQSRR